MHTSNYIMRLSMSTSGQKPYTEYWLSPLSFCFWLDGINSRFKSHLDNKSKGRTRFYNQRVRQSRCRRTKTVDKDILTTYTCPKASLRNFSELIITTGNLQQEQGIRNNSASSLFHKPLMNVMWMKSLSERVSWNEIHRSFICLPRPYHFIW